MAAPRQIPPKGHKDDRTQVRLVAVVLVLTMGGWLGLQYLGGALNWPPRFIFLFDLAALAGFVYALVVTYRIWLGRKG